ncbi:hypothetical protein SY83_08470 [Paenibacillus swuensis]|uniref:Holin n=1 Tax=Paenibacillus swuensis TaxID=1178515 RepID=A0A172THD8_9BACL|nr:hypothetical protein [Paenibacillus swuensis]ANE46304.1 hypothetical protein SY83_08470 [Paenibacillus swuensis]
MKPKWYQGLLSLDEAKYSALILCLLAGMGYGLALCMKDGDIPDNLTMILSTLILTVGGVNALQGVVDHMASSRKEKLKSQSKESEGSDATMLVPDAEVQVSVSIPGSESDIP